MFAISPVLVNGKFYNKLTPELQELLTQWVAKTEEYNWKISEEDDEASKKTLQEKGLKVHELTPEMKAAIDDKMEDFYKWYETIIPDAPKWVEHCKAREVKAQ